MQFSAYFHNSNWLSRHTTTSLLIANCLNFVNSINKSIFLYICYQINCLVWFRVNWHSLRSICVGLVDTINKINVEWTNLFSSMQHLIVVLQPNSATADLGSTACVKFLRGINKCSIMILAGNGGERYSWRRTSGFIFC